MRKIVLIILFCVFNFLNLKAQFPFVSSEGKFSAVFNAKPTPSNVNSVVKKVEYTDYSEQIIQYVVYAKSNDGAAQKKNTIDLFKTNFFKSAQGTIIDEKPYFSRNELFGEEIEYKLSNGLYGITRLFFVNDYFYQINYSAKDLDKTKATQFLDSFMYMGK